MENKTELTEISAAEFDSFSAVHPYTSFQKKSSTAELKGSFGWRKLFLALKKDGETVAAALFLGRRMPVFNKYLYYSPHGYLIDYENTELLAEFHACTAGFDPGAKAELPIVPLVSNLSTQFPHRCDVLPPANRFRLLWEKELGHVLRACDKAWEYLSQHEKELPAANCHCDFHPGNVKWKGSRCCVLFDLDWAKLDKRLFDVVYALIYIVFSWDSENNGDIDMEELYQLICRLKEKAEPVPGTDIHIFFKGLQL